MESRKIIVALRNVTKTYRLGKTEVHALYKVSLDIAPGGFLAVTGPSGSGKSTLMNLIGCLDVPSSGDIFIKEQKVNSLTDKDLARIRGEEIGFVFQSFNLVPRITALQNTVLPMAFTSKIPTSQRRARAEQLLKQVGLEGRMSHKPSELSGGEIQRVAVARALANNPSLILADEPTGNLDSDTGKGIMDLFGSLNKEGRTLVVVTHNPSVAGRAERTIELKDGSMVETGR